MSDNGEEKDFLAPYDPFQVNLPFFDGPLDLLLHLVRKQQVDINEMRLSELTEPYLAYLDQMKDLNLDQAGEFLTIASTLVWIKSKTLLPRQFDDDEPDPESVEEMLLLRLQEYQKFKEVAHELRAMDLLGRDVFPRQAAVEKPEQAEGDPVFEEVSLFALIEAFREVLERSEQEHTLHVIPERERIEDRIADLLTRLAEKKRVFFRELLGAAPSRPEIIIAFIALLELVRLKAIRVIQSGIEGEIYCQVTEAFEAGGTDWTAVLTGSLLGEAAPPSEPEPEPRPN